MKRFFNLDFAGSFASLLCAIHCSAVPIFISLGLLSSSTWLHNHAIDWAVIGLGIVIASISLIGDYLNSHRNPKPLLLALVGFVLLAIGMVEHHGIMLVFSVLGGLTVAISHWINYKLGRTCVIVQKH